MLGGMKIKKQPLACKWPNTKQAAMNKTYALFTAPAVWQYIVYHSPHQPGVHKQL